MSEPEYDIFDALGFDVYDYQRQAWQQWSLGTALGRAVKSSTPKTEVVTPSPQDIRDAIEKADAARREPMPWIMHPNDYAAHLAEIWMEEIAEWEPYREATRAWANLGLRPTEHPDLYRVALAHAGPYRAPDVEPDWTTWLPDCDLAIRSKSIVTWVERDGMLMNRWDARDYDAMKAKWQAQQGDSATQLDT